MATARPPGPSPLVTYQHAGPALRQRPSLHHWAISQPRMIRRWPHHSPRANVENGQFCAHQGCLHRAPVAAPNGGSVRVSSDEPATLRDHIAISGHAVQQDRPEFVRTRAAASRIPAQCPSGGYRRTGLRPVSGNCSPSTTNGDHGSRTCLNDPLIPTLRSCRRQRHPLRSDLVHRPHHGATPPPAASPASSADVAVVRRVLARLVQRRSQSRPKTGRTSGTKP